MKQNIGLLISTLNDGGAERVISRLSYILKDNYNLSVILFDSRNMKYEHYGNLIDLKVEANNGNILSKFVLLFRRVLRLKRIKKENNLCAVISFLDSPNIVNILSNNKECDVIVSVRNFLSEERDLSLLNRLTDFAMKLLYKKADRVIPVSKQIRELLIQKYNIESNKIKTIYNPFDVEMIKRLSIEDLDEKHNEFMDSNKIFISVGRQMYQKGFWHLVKAFKLVHDQDDEVKLVIVGRDEQNGKLQHLVNELGVQDSILLTGYQKNPFKFIKKSNIYILSSLFEGFPNALVEAMACGCPVIATDCKSGPKEILFEESDLSVEINEITYADYGVLVPALESNENWDPFYHDINEKTLATAMLKLLNDKNKLKHYSKMSLERAQRFNYDRCKDEFISIL
ncbi:MULTISPECIES: glycosyltransferase [unclassified Paenibacillus]|uniref:glycosyltransferase n=1 Tax=unclassified Paenibacillus TaxID=185978 RepID=UPI001AEB95A2|nr:glycosyltransferase involved in cell wall biosynthesis [Paenibacillus sp. PvP091]MBP1170214.1 glycosyltransferase involved in cell wall biosynthesis [Paenibacillus sp. PvR098]MBP2441242.1 glycosyltransferase involved in cell wall biosynthesis [Paenibacillus sp. PvP052]